MLISRQMRARALVLAALLAPASAGAAAAPAAAAKPSSGGTDQASLEAYLKSRHARIKENHQARLEFLAKQQAAATAFFDQIRDERSAFESRMTRQRLSLFESLISLNPKDHANAVVDFEKLQSNVTRAFEMELKQKMSKFFSEREAVWRSFAVTQEKGRESFAADGEVAWQSQKAAVMKAAEGAVMKAAEGAKK